MNGVTKALIVCLAFVAGWVAFQQIKPATAPAVDDTTCSAPGGG